jgi:hypothetical protein
MTGLKPQRAPQETSDDEVVSTQQGTNNPLPALNALNAELAALCDEGALNENELRAVTSLVAYVAYTQETSEDTVLASLTTEFGVDDVKSLPSDDYEDAVRFLVDFRFNELMN